MQEFNLFHGLFVNVFFLHSASPTDEDTPYHSDVVVVLRGFVFFIIFCVISEVFEMNFESMVVDFTNVGVVVVLGWWLWLLEGLDDGLLHIFQLLEDA